MTVTERSVARLAEGDVVEYAITTPRGTVLRVMSWGATLTSLQVPDREGLIGEVTLGYPDAESFISSSNPPYFGVTVGRFANRIRGGRFLLDGREYRLVCNDGGRHHLHGGKRGFDKRVWRGEPFRSEGIAGVRFHLRSEDGEEGYPGTLEVTAEYSLALDSTLTMTYEARTSALTVINLTNHTYWNLGGSGTVLNHGLRLEASSYVEVDADLMPTGRLATVGGSPFDFRSERMVGERIGATGGGYDHCYALDAARDGGKLALAATLHDSRSGRVMEVSTTEPGVQLYTGNFLELASFPLHAALCLETQHFPDSVNHAQFPSAVLRPGQTFRQSTVHRFGVR